MKDNNLYLLYNGDLYEKIATNVIDINRPNVKSNGCEGCIYDDNDSDEEPCVYCKNNYQNKWQGK